MSAREIQELAQQFAVAFSNKDVEAVLGMLSDDVEVFRHVPYASTTKAQFGGVSRGCRQRIRVDELSLSVKPSCRISTNPRVS